MSPAIKWSYVLLVFVQNPYNYLPYSYADQRNFVLRPRLPEIARKSNSVLPKCHYIYLCTFSVHLWMFPNFSPTLGWEKILVEILQEKCEIILLISEYIDLTMKWQLILIFFFRFDQAYSQECWIWWCKFNS